MNVSTCASYCNSLFLSNVIKNIPALNNISRRKNSNHSLNSSRLSQFLVSLSLFCFLSPEIRFRIKKNEKRKGSNLIFWFRLSFFHLFFFSLPLSLRADFLPLGGKSEWRHCGWATSQKAAGYVATQDRGCKYRKNSVSVMVGLLLSVYVRVELAAVRAGVPRISAAGIMRCFVSYL